MTEGIEIRTGRPSRIGLAEVAAAANVSKATVCRALLGRGRISTATRERIKKLAAELGYQADPALSALTRYRWGDRVSARSKYSIAFIVVTQVPKNSRQVDSTSREVGVEGRAGELSLLLEKHVLADQSSTAALSRALYARGVDGVIFHISGPVFEWDFQWEKFSCVTMGFDGEAHRLNSVTSDWFTGLRMLVDKARSAGYRRIGFANFYRGNPSMDARTFGATLVERDSLVREVGPQPAIYWYPKDRNLDKPWIETEGVPFMRWFEKEKPDVVIDGNRLAVWWLRNKGIRVPDDVGYLALNAAGVSEPDIAGAVHQRERQGRIAVDLLFNMIQSNERGQSDSPLRITTPCEWYPASSFLIPARTKPALRRKS